MITTKEIGNNGWTGYQVMGKFKKLFASLLLVALLPGGINAEAVVFCLGADGHAVVETVVAGTCGVDCNAPAPAEVLPPAMKDGDDGCGPCLDISSSHQWGSPRTFADSIHIDLPVTLLQAAVAIANDAVLQPINNGLIVEPAPRIPEPILLHRTTVLLI
jgi:hypothetical protein